MQVSPTIAFRGINGTEGLEDEIRTHIEKLETYYPRIMGCHVLVEFVQRHHESGNRFHVRIDITVPGEEIVVSHEASLRATTRHTDAAKIKRLSEPDPARKHANVAVHEAFNIARRRLQDYARRQGGSVKTPVVQEHGRVPQLFPVDEYGYLEAADGHEVYFQKSSVLKDGFDRLAVGATVSYVEEPGEKGPQASTVKLLHPSRAARTAHATAPSAH